VARASPSGRACCMAQAGVDLGTVLADFEAEQRQAKKHGVRGRSRAGSEAPAAPSLRPKRRQPISEVLLVGGATRMPAVHRFVANMTRLTPREFVVDPDQACAPSLLACALMLVS
jgi:heat shock 70kDa protein 1/2/6/8